MQCSIGPYEIQSPLGAGGMGEVYLARDTRLDRTVAIKVLPSHLSDNPEVDDNGPIVENARRSCDAARRGRQQALAQRKMAALLL